MEELKNIQKLAKALDGHTLITKEDLAAILTDIGNILAQFRSASKEINVETKDTLNLIVKQVNEEHKRIIDEVKTVNVNLKDKVEVKMASVLSEINAISKDILSSKPKDGNDGADGTNGADGVNGNDGSPDTANQIADKLNTTTESIDAKVIKGLNTTINNIVAGLSKKGGDFLARGVIGIRMLASGLSVKENGTEINFSTGLTATPTVNGVIVTATGGAATITTQDEGVTLSGSVNTLNFVGAGVTATGAGSTTTITIPGGAGSGDMILASAQTNTGAKTFLATTLLLRNVANTFSSLFTNTNTAARTYTLKDADGTLAFTSDITGTNSNTNTGDNATNSQYSGLVTNATHTGDATGATALTVVRINGVSMAGLATGLLKNTTTTGVPSIAINSDLPVMSATVGGAVPTPPNNTTTFLRGDGTFATPAGSGDMVLANAQTNSGVKTFLDATLGLRNVANSITSFFTNTATVARTYTLKDASGTIAFTSDITGINSNTNTGDQTITLTGGVTGSGTGSFAATVITNANLTGPVTSTGNATAVTNNAITNAMAAQMATKTYKGRTSAATGNAEDVAVATLKTDLVLVKADVGLANVDNTSNATERAAVRTLTNVRNQPRTSSTTTAATLDPDLSSANVYFRTTQTATLTISAPIGTPVIGEVITIYVDSVAAQTLTINATYVAFGAAFPATTTAGKTFMMTAMFNGTNYKTTWASQV